MSNEQKTKSGRDAKGRFLKGSVPNPQGRPAGGRNKATLLLEGMISEQGHEIVQECITRAMDGDNALLKALLERLVPVRKDSPMTATLPRVKTLADLPKALLAVQEQLTSGELTPSEATAIAALLEHHRKALESTELETRLARIEAAIEEIKK
jgi:hypothetical protein